MKIIYGTPFCTFCHNTICDHFKLHLVKPKFWKWAGQNFHSPLLRTVRLSLLHNLNIYGKDYFSFLSVPAGIEAAIPSKVLDRFGSCYLEILIYQLFGNMFLDVIIAILGKPIQLSLRVDFQENKFVIGRNNKVYGALVHIFFYQE